MTSDISTEPEQWPSIDDHQPNEEGGPTARSGLAYQDEIVVGIFLDMIGDPSIQKVHCETHDDIIVKRLVVDLDTVEYIQVKSNEPNKLWSAADMCANGKDSLCAKSLARDRHKEASRFRIVTLRDVTSEIRSLILYTGLEENLPAKRSLNCPPPQKGNSQMRYRRKAMESTTGLSTVFGRFAMTKTVSVTPIS